MQFIIFTRHFHYNDYYRLYNFISFYLIFSLRNLFLFKFPIIFMIFQNSILDFSVFNSAWDISNFSYMNGNNIKNVKRKWEQELFRKNVSIIFFVLLCSFEVIANACTCKSCHLINNKKKKNGETSSFGLKDWIWWEWIE